jgi:hypothetical protein
VAHDTGSNGQAALAFSGFLPVSPSAETAYFDEKLPNFIK